MRPGGRTHPRASPQSIGHQVTPVEDAAMAVVAAIVKAEVVGEPVMVPHQAIKALPRMLQTSVDGAS